MSGELYKVVELILDRGLVIDVFVRVSVIGLEVALVDLLDRLLAGGIVLAGDITLAIADIDMVQISRFAL